MRCESLFALAGWHGDGRLLQCPDGIPSSRHVMNRPPADWPLPPPKDWVAWVKQPQTTAEVAALRRCVDRGRPLGQDSWVRRTALALGLQTTLRPRGRPKKAKLNKGS